MKQQQFKITWLVIILLLPMSLHSQFIEWQKAFGGEQEDILRSMEATKDNGIIVGGSSWSNISGEKTEDSRGYADYWILKLDSLGNIEWQKTIGGESYDQLMDIHQTIDCGYILGGISDSDISGDKTEDSNGGDDYWIVKLDSTGNIEWQNTIGGESIDVFHSIQQTIDEGYIVCGSSFSNTSGDKTEDSKGQDDYWIVKLNNSGNIEWQKTIGGESADRWPVIITTNDKGFLVGGDSQSDISGDKSENTNGLFDYWILKLDSTGNIEWQNTIGGLDNDRLRAISQTQEGGYALGGYSKSNISGDKMDNSNGERDIWIIKVDSIGNIEWQNTIGGSYDEHLFSLQLKKPNGFVIGSHSVSDISGDKSENSRGWSDYWILGITEEGEVEWQKTIGGNSREWLFSAYQSNDGKYLIGGMSISTISGDKTEPLRGIDDYWVLKLNSDFINFTKDVAIGDEITIFPNPANSKLFFNPSIKPNSSILIYSNLGLLAQKNETKTITEQVDISNLSNGKYTVVIRTANKVCCSTFIKMK